MKKKGREGQYVCKPICRAFEFTPCFRLYVNVNFGLRFVEIPKDSIAHVYCLLTNLIDCMCTYLPCCILAVPAACTTRQPPPEWRGFPKLGVRNLPAMEGMVYSFKSQLLFATVICNHFRHHILSFHYECDTKQITKDPCAYHCVLQHCFSLGNG